MDLPKDKAQELLESKSRRNFLKATGSLAAVVGIASGQTDSVEDGTLTGGSAMLEEAYQVGPRTWMGPDSAKATVEEKTGRKYEAIDTNVQYYAENGEWQGPLEIGSEDKSVPSVHTDELHGIADYIVKDKETLQTLFPGGAADSTPLEAGDTVIIAPEDPPIRHDQDLFINNAGSGVTVLGQYWFGSEFELKPADESEAFGFRVENDDVTIEGISYHGNKDGQSHGNGMPFVEHRGNNLYVGYNYCRETYPYHVHNELSHMFYSPPWRDAGPIYGYYNQCEDIGDRMWTMINCEEVHIYGDRSVDGFDRMAQLMGVNKASVIGCYCKNNIQGSIFGASAKAMEGTHMVFAFNHAEGTMRNFGRILHNENSGHDITFIGNTAVKTSKDEEGFDRPAINQQGDGGQDKILCNWFEGFGYGGLELSNPDTQVAYNHFRDITDDSGDGRGLFHFLSGSDINIEANNTWDWPNTTAIPVFTGVSNATRPRWEGVIGGGPLGGVDLSTVTGQYQGDKATADGTTATVSDVDAIWDDTNTQWVYPDSTSTV